MTNYDILSLFYLLDKIPSFEIEEAKDFQDEIITLDQIKKVNSGNNCLHYILTKNHNRIVIQTYKDMDRKGQVDVVQGTPESCIDFQNILNLLNEDPDFTDDIINRCFVLYKWYWDHCDGVYISKRDALCTFGMSDCWLQDNQEWYLNLPENSNTNDQVIHFVREITDIIERSARRKA